MVGTGVSACVGVLIKVGKSLEATAKTTAIVFDKTGKFIMGEQRITTFIHLYLNDDRNDSSLERSKSWRNDCNKLLWLLASLKWNSEHPLASAVVEYAIDHVEEISSKNDLGHPTDFAAKTGRGVNATLPSITRNFTLQWEIVPFFLNLVLQSQPKSICQWYEWKTRVKRQSWHWLITNWSQF